MYQQLRKFINVIVSNIKTSQNWFKDTPTQPSHTFRVPWGINLVLTLFFAFRMNYVTWDYNSSLSCLGFACWEHSQQVKVRSWNLL